MDDGETGTDLGFFFFECIRIHNSYSHHKKEKKKKLKI
jgi:hypothetical protein